MNVVQRRPLVVDLDPPDVSDAPPAMERDLLADAWSRVRRERFDVIRTWEIRRRGVQRSLHDGAQQQLLGLRLALLHGADRPTADHVARLDEVVADIEGLAIGLPPSALRMDDVAGTLREIAAQSGLSVGLDLPDRLSTSMVVAEVLVYTVSEALANTLRHAGPVRCELSLRAAGDDLELQVADRGAGGAHVVLGRGLAGLRSRAEDLGGELSVRSDADGTSLTLHVSDTGTWELEPATAPEPMMPSWDAEARDLLRATVQDAALEVGFFVAERGAWYDEQGTALAATSPDWNVRIDRRGAPIALVASSSAIHTVVATCDEHFRVLLEGAARASGAAAVSAVAAERDRLGRRAAAFESSLARRLTSRPVHQLRQAQEVLISGDREGAALLVLEATNTLRAIVSALGGRTTSVDDGDASDPFLFGLLAAQADVVVDVHVGDVPPPPARDAITMIGEEILADAGAGDSVRIRVVGGARRVMVTVGLRRLPSSKAIAFVEDTVSWLDGTMTCRPVGDEVRVRVDLPCEW